jgi:hypothetical protein
MLAPASCGDTIVRLRPLRQPEARQSHPSQPDAEFLQRLSARDRLSHALGEFIEFVVHSLNFVALFLFAYVFSNSLRDKVVQGDRTLLDGALHHFPPRGKLPWRRYKSFEVPGDRAGGLGSEHDNLGDLREALGSDAGAGATREGHLVFGIEESWVKRIRCRRCH